MFLKGMYKIATCGLADPQVGGVDFIEISWRWRGKVFSEYTQVGQKKLCEVWA
jgi:hypothetical protein